MKKMLLQPQNLTEYSRTFNESLRPDIAGFSQPAHHLASGGERRYSPDSSGPGHSPAQSVPTGSKPDKGSDFTSDRNTYESNSPTTSSHIISSHNREEKPAQLNTKSVEKKSVVFNYSSIILTDSMDRLLNRGLNFSILPKTLDTTQLLTELKKLERPVVWHEFWHGREEENVNDREIPIFKTVKTNMPKNYSSPKGLKMFLGAVKSDLIDPRNRNREECNLPQDELNALKDLINLQKDRKIVIKACDKGAGIIILNFNEYVKAC